jgi:hypothetical protein
MRSISPPGRRIGLLLALTRVALFATNASTASATVPGGES